MTKWIRWSGFAGFSLLLFVFFGFYYFAAGPLLKLSLETFGSKALGAKLEVASVDFELNPLKLIVNKVNVTDKSNPMKNLVSFDRAEADLLFLPLLLGKTIIDDVAIEGVSFDTDRQVSGALVSTVKVSDAAITSNENQPADDVKQSQKTVNSIGDKALSALPSADTLLAREPLLTVVRGEQIQRSVDLHKKQISQANQALPTQADLKKYEGDLKALVSGSFKSLDDFKARKQAFDTLKKQIKLDQAAIKQAKRVLSQAKKDLSQQWPDLQNAPVEDAKNIKGKYTLDGVGAQNLTALLLGDDVNAYIQKGLGYYEKLSPLFDSGETEKTNEQESKGRFVEFKTDRPLPDFWIKALTFELKLSNGDIQVVMHNISQQPDVINKPISLNARGVQLTNMDEFNLDGVLDYRHQTVQNRFDFNIQKWHLEDQALGIAGLSLKQGELDIQGQAQVYKASLLADVNGLFTQTEFSSDASSRFAKEMSQSLAGIDQFTLSGTMKGDLSSPALSIKSDLDNKLKKAFKQRLKQRQAVLEGEIRQKLSTKLLAYAGDYKNEIEQLNLTQTDLNTLSKTASKLAKSELSSYQDQLKAEAKAKAKAKTDQQKEALKDALKDKFKSLF